MDNIFSPDSGDNRTRAILYFLFKERRKLNDSFAPGVNLSKGEGKAESKAEKDKTEKGKTKENKTEIDTQQENTKNSSALPEKPTKPSKSKNKKDSTPQKNQANSDEISKENKIFVTEIFAEDPLDNKLKSWSGPHIIAKSEEDAHFLIQNTGLGYCRLIGELMGLIDNNGNDVKDAYKLN